MKSRVLRLSAAALLVGAAAVTISPHLTNHISSSAVVNAPLLTVRAPFDGVLMEGSADFATVVPGDRRLLRVEAQRQDQGTISTIEAEIGGVRAQIAALDVQRAAVLDLQGDLRRRIQAYDGASRHYLEVAQREASAVLEGAEIERQRSESEFVRITQLAEAGATSQSSLNDVGADHRTAVALVAEATARRDALEVRIRLLGSGIALDGTTDGTYARQRLDEVGLQIGDLTARHDTLAGQLIALEAQGDAIAADLARRTIFEPVAAATAVVWRAAPTEGTSVAAGDTLMELLDCENRFLEVSLPGRLFEDIQPGVPATVLFKGSEVTVGAFVEAVGGAGARFDHPSLASDPPEVDDGGIQVLVRLDPADPTDPKVAASFCDVGRTAEVRFARTGGAAFERVAAFARTLIGWADGFRQASNQAFNHADPADQESSGAS